MNKILVLGAGLVSRPGVHYLLGNPDLQVTVAEKIVERAESLVKGFGNGQSVFLDVEDVEALINLIARHDIVISLLPWTFHVRVAELCLEYRKHMVTTSYVSEGMRKLAPEVEKNGLIFLNEIGVDPGMDHMTAKRIIDHVQAEGGAIIEFRSICGGLPAPENNDNPFGYKFSWSPRGVLLASRNSARFLDNGKIVEIPGSDLFLHYSEETLPGIGRLEVYPNRDSLVYREKYNLNGLQGLFRGTYRYPGWCRTMKALSDLGMLDDTPIPPLQRNTFRELTARLLGIHPKEDLAAAAAEKTGLRTGSAGLNRLDWLGLFQDYSLPEGDTCLDILCQQMQKKLYYSQGEKDMLILKHEFLVESPQKGREQITSTLIDYGVPHGDSAMARTVSLPMAIATHLIAQNRIRETGVRIPVDPEIYDPVLTELEKLGIKMDEEKISVP